MDRWARRSMQLRKQAQQTEGSPSADRSNAASHPNSLDFARPAMGAQSFPVAQTQVQPLPQFAPPSGAVPSPGQPGFRANAVPMTDLPPAAPTIRQPTQLQKVTQILPYIDYEPDPKLAKDAPCTNQCPTPDGKPCKGADGRPLECPQEIPLSVAPYQPRMYSPTVYAWAASNICYNPLYFEDPQLERYGHAWPFFVQPLVSTARFTVQAIGIPYQMTLNPPCSAVYPLGFYRPGEYSPKQIEQIPWNTEAALVEAAAVTGVFFLFPH